MDDRLSGRISLEQASDLLRKQWERGMPDLAAVAEMITPSNLESTLAIVLVHAQLRLQSGQDYDVEYYLNCFPQLASQRSLLTARLAETRTIAEAQVPDSAPSSFEMFSARSVAATDFYDSSKRKTAGEQAAKRTGPRSARNRSRESLPQTIGNFEIESYLGEGTFGVVLLGRDKRLGRMVAIKVKDSGGDRSLSDDFLHEARSICRLDHPNIVRLLQADETEEGVGYLVYEFVDGQMLDARIEKSDYSIDEAVRWIASIAQALDYAHRRGIVHRDVSPRNIMIGTDGTAKLLDFGLSSIDNEFYIDEQNYILGTPNFVSPEQASGNPHWATAHADIFSLASVLYYTLTKKLPFAGKTTFDVLERVQRATPASLRSHRPEIPVELEQVCLRALSKEPQQRYSTAGDMSLALLDAVSGAKRPTHKPRSSKLGNYAMLAVGLVLFLLGSAASIWGVVHTSPAPLPNIEAFDLMLRDNSQGTQSLLAESRQDPIRLSDQPTLTIKAGLKDRRFAKIFMFHFADGNRASGTWHAFDVEGAVTTLDSSVLRPGPNICLLVCSNKPIGDDLALPSEPIELRTSTAELQPNTVRRNTIVYLYWDHTSFQSSKFSRDTIERNRSDDREPVSDDDFVNQLAERWSGNSIFFNKSGLDDCAYCGVAFWVDQGALTK